MLDSSINMPVTSDSGEESRISGDNFAGREWRFGMSETTLGGSPYWGSGV